MWKIAPPNTSAPSGRNAMDKPWAACKLFTLGGRLRNRSPTLFLFYGGIIIAKKNPIISVKFSYVGKDSDFELFLKTIVRDYLAADNPAENPDTDFVQKVESENS